MKKIILLSAIFFCSLHSICGQAGKLDPSFGNNGIVTADFGEKSNYSGVTKKILTQTDGSIFAILDVSGKTLITKTLSNGSADTSYGSNGFSSMASITTNDAAFQNDGKIVIAGSSNSVFGVARFNRDGSIDNSFSVGELTMQYEHQFNRISVFNVVAIQNDGKILLGGFAGIDEENSNTTIARLNTDGSADKTFGDEGVLNEGGISSRPYAIASQSDGKIVVASTDFFGRYNTDGSRDLAFNQKILANTNYSISSVKIQSDGKIVAGNSMQIVRYNIDGSLDNSFSNEGKLQIEMGNIAAIDDNNKIIVTASSSIRRYNTNGSLDVTFNKNGVQTTDFEIGSIAIQSNGKIVAAGLFNRTSGSDLHGARYNTNGSLDITYGKSGNLIRNLINDIKAGYTTYTSTAIQKDGKIVSIGAANGSSFDVIVTRYNVDGSLDNTFNGNGMKTFAFALNSLAIQNDGKIVLAGPRFLGRYNINGTEDPAFNTKVANAANFDIASLIIQNDGKILVSGSAMVRFNIDGSPDNTFNGNGIVNLPFPTRRAALQSDDKIVFAGTYNDNFAVARLNTNGSLDNSFSNDGIQTVEFTDYDDNHLHSEASLLAVQRDDKIVVSGSGIVNNRASAEYTLYFIKQFNKDGRPEPYFFPATPTDMVARDSGIVVSEENIIYPFFNNNESTDSTFPEIQTSAYDINSIAIANNKLYAVGTTGIVGIAARYLLDGKIQTPPTVTITTPANNTTRLAPAAHIKLSAAASDADGSISKVEFYSGTHLLHTETVIPYGFVWRNVPLGNYTLTAKAYDNDGLVTTSAPVHISVVPNKPPVVSIINPKNNETFAASINIQIEADAKDLDGRMTRVEFYNGSTLLNTQYQLPYRFVWKEVPAGTYTITAVARDNWGARTKSVPVTITVKSNTTIVSSRVSVNSIDKVNAASITLSPNPANTTVNLNTTGLQLDKPTTIKILSASGVVMKTMQLNTSAKAIQLNISSLVSGVYTIQLISDERVLYKQFVKL